MMSAVPAVCLFLLSCVLAAGKVILHTVCCCDDRLTRENHDEYTISNESALSVNYTSQRLFHQKYILNI